MNTLTRSLFAGLLIFSILPAAAQKEIPRTGGPYVPTPQIVVDRMLSIAGVGADDYVFDLGSGDGVIVLTAATRYQARGMGVDIDPHLVQLSNAEAKRLGVADRVSFHVEDVFKADLSRASVVTMYLLPAMMLNLRSKIFFELKPGTRVVSHDYDFNEWAADERMTFDVPEKEKINGVGNATVSLWIVPAKIGGVWQLKVDGAEAHRMTVRQSFQEIEGTATLAGRTAKLIGATLRGDAIAFSLVGGAGRHAYTGRVSGDTMQGAVDLGSGRRAAWTAVRAPVVSAGNF